MPEATTTHGLSPADFALMRAIVTWRREQVCGQPRAVFCKNRAWGGYLSWTERNPDVPVRRLRDISAELVFAGDETWPRQYRMSIDPDDACSISNLEPRSVTEAVDLLVAVGVLPTKFSSAYRAGWDARADAADADGCLEMVNWPELEPAVDR